VIDLPHLILHSQTTSTDLPNYCNTNRRTGMRVSQVVDEVLYTGLVEMQELPELEE
jgi:hypothetical protein